MPTMVFYYDKEKIDKLNKLAQNESRTRSSYIQKILFDFFKSKGDKGDNSKVNPKKKVKLKRRLK